MKFLSLFAGIGGFDLGLERAGMACVGQVEIDPWCRKVLEKHWPKVPRHDDVKTFTKEAWEGWETPDVVCGGYPCQPFSFAGSRAGESDPRHLWPEFARVLRGLRPRYALLENVAGHLSLGFEHVLGDLAALGYDAEWAVFPASAFGAWHKRDRLFVVAYAYGERRRKKPITGEERQNSPLARDDGKEESMADATGERRREARGLQRERTEERAAGGSKAIDAADANGIGRERSAAEHGEGRRKKSARSGGVPDADNPGREEQLRAFTKPEKHFAAQCRGFWSVEPDVGRVADGVPRRVDRLRGLGNAIVPQVAEYVGRCVMEMEACKSE